jgi:hypothetical protein
MRHSNQIGIFWQVEISAISQPLSSYGLTKLCIGSALNDVKGIIAAGRMGLMLDALVLLGDPGITFSECPQEK